MTLVNKFKGLSGADVGCLWLFQACLSDVWEQFGFVLKRLKLVLMKYWGSLGCLGLGFGSSLSGLGGIGHACGRSAGALGQMLGDSWAGLGCLGRVVGCLAHMVGRLGWVLGCLGRVMGLS